MENISKEFKLVTATLRPEVSEAVIDALRENKLKVIATESKSVFPGAEWTVAYNGNKYITDYYPAHKIEVIVPTERLESIVKLISSIVKDKDAQCEPSKDFSSICVQDGIIPENK